VIGPNCFGIYCPRSGLTLIPGPELPRESGGLAFLSQSGGMSIDFAHMCHWKGLRFSKVVSYGNGADLRETELLRYLGEDPETKIIAMYIEGVEDGREFFRALREVSERKPVVIYKGGLSEAGQRAVASHTASMGGARSIWESALRQCNAVRVETLDEMADICLAFSLLPPRAYRGITVSGGGGALGVAAADSAEAFGLSIPLLDKRLQEAILPLLPQPGSSASNPLDMANPFFPPDGILKALTIAARDENIDLQILIQLLYHYKSLSGLVGVQSVKAIAPVGAIVGAAVDLAKNTGKPMVMVLPSMKRDTGSMEIEELIRETRQAMVDKGIPVYDELRNAMGAIGRVSRYYAVRERRAGKFPVRSAGA
jgi:acyl-CoA synthetase (NDP forming)